MGCTRHPGWCRPSCWSVDSCLRLLLGQKFFSPFALTLILQQVQIVGILGAAQSLVILTAGIDLSVGAIMVLSSVVMGQFTFRYGLPPELAVLPASPAAHSAALSTAFSSPCEAAALHRHARHVADRAGHQFPLFRQRDHPRPGHRQPGAAVAVLRQQDQIWRRVFTYGAIFMVLLVLFLAYVLKQTAWGRHVYAVGDDPEAAELSGVKVKRTLISVYMLSGLICAFAGWALIGRIGSVSPTSGQLGNIESITAVVIGGISLFGGRGSIMGMLFGALIVGVFSLGLRLLGADAQWTYLLIGVLIIAAVTVDQWIRKVSV
jgi:fructose transport system permease protein